MFLNWNYISSLIFYCVSLRRILMKVKKWIYLFLVPGLVLYLTFFILPLIGVFYYSFTDWGGVGSDLNITGLENFTSLSNDSVFSTSFMNNLKFLFTV